MRHGERGFLYEGNARVSLRNFQENHVGLQDQYVGGKCRFSKSRSSNDTEEKWGESVINVLGVGILWMYRGKSRFSTQSRPLIGHCCFNWKVRLLFVSVRSVVLSGEYYAKFYQNLNKFASLECFLNDNK